MRLGDEPNNWLGLALLLALVAVIAIAIRWAGLAN
jgi:hypothetical protein